MKKHSLFIIGLLSITSVSGQEVVSSSGQTHTSGQLIVSQTVGETLVSTLSNGITINQGFHQNELIITATSETNESLELTIYPNPFAERVIISCKEELGTIRVYNIAGEEVFQHSNYKGQNTAELELSHLPAGQYLIRVPAVNRPKSSTYAIIKL